MLLDAVVDYMPSPLDIPAVKGTNPDTDEEETRAVDDKAPLSALAFKIMADPFVGKMAFFRVYSGTLQSGTYVYNSTKGKKNVSAVSFVCTLTTVKKFRKLIPVISAAS